MPEVGLQDCFLDRYRLPVDRYGMAQPAHSYEHYTWGDYRSWTGDERWEIIGGRAFAMSPSPGFRHQEICVGIGTELRAFLKGKPCRTLLAPMDVKLSDADVVQPDILVVCDPRKIAETHIEGPPDLVVEIASPSTASRERTLKLILYAKHGVKEYWIVTPYPHLVEVLLLDGETYRIHRVFTAADTLTSPTLPGLEFALEGVFDFPIPDDERIDEVREATPPYPPLAAQHTGS